MKIIFQRMCMIKHKQNCGLIVIKISLHVIALTTYVPLSTKYNILKEGNSEKIKG